MLIRPYNTSDKPRLIEIYDKSLKAIRPGVIMNEEIFDNIILTVEDQTDLSKDCLVVEDRKGKIIGFACLYKSSERDSWWLNYHTIPKYHRSKILLQLVKSVLNLVDKQKAPRIIFDIIKRYYMDSPLQTIIKERGLEPIHFDFQMRLDNIREVPKSVIPTNIIFKNENELTDYTGYVSVMNDAFKDHFEFKPFTEEKYKSVRTSAEKHYSYVNWLAYDENKLVGLCSSAINPKTKHLGYVSQLAVLHSYHRRGIGSALLGMGVHSLIEKGCKVIELGVEAKNEKALSIYEKFGFYEVESQTEIVFAIE